MRAAVFARPGVCEFVERDLAISADNHVLVRVEACGVCGTDAHIYSGSFPARFPVIAGHEFAGIVEEVGPRVTMLRSGDAVAIDPNIPCGSCPTCRRGRSHLCRNRAAIGVTQDGGFATHCLLPAQQCHKLPPSFPAEVAALAEPVACCVHGIDRAAIRSGDVVFILGCGGIGLILLQLALLQGASAVIASDPKPEKREMALQLGATGVLDPGTEDVAQAAAAAAGGAGPDVVIEAVGASETAQQAVDIVGDGGRVVLFGVAPEQARVSVAPYEVYRRELTITGSLTNPFTHDRALALLASGKVKVDRLISHRVRLDEIPKGLELLESGAATKVLVEPQRST